ncbi:GntR family transcriptional regulator [Amycolatopsis taiwanensis]|uniref:GntR family transcriptional regulator n=1 Tax=Amycolatopsis taiwanensis TaxID=342230 RepID=UPI00048643D6|nr:GntR family transcriptional regulator [Amycolatopsis taiwanensis]
MSEPSAVGGLAETLRLAIHHGELTPGQRLVEAELAKRYRTSRGTVREALVLLTNEGLVSREPNRGAQVRPVSLAEAIEITEVRAMLEGLCAAKAAQAITATERRQLRAIGRRMNEAAETGDILVYGRLSQQVHIRVREIAAQDTISGILERLRCQSVRYQFQVALLPDRAAHGAREHSAIIDAVCSRDRAAAEHLMRVHLETVADVLRGLET